MKRLVATVLGIYMWAATGCLELNTNESSGGASGDGGAGGNVGVSGNGGFGNIPAGAGGSIDVFCGNGVVETGEECDDGNPNNGDGCSTSCKHERMSSLFIGQPGISGFADGNGSSALLTSNSILALVGDDLYLGDNSTVRVANVNTAEVKTIAGMAGAAGYKDALNGVDARFNNVNGFATDGTTLWIADTGNQVLRAISISSPHASKTLAGVAGMAGSVDGLGAQARFEFIRGLTYLNGILYILDATAAVLRSYDPQTTEVRTLAGIAYTLGGQDGIGTAARFTSPRYITSDGVSKLFIVETQGSKIRQYDIVTQEVTTLAGTGICGHVNGIGAAVRLNTPRGIAHDGLSIYWVESESHTVRQEILATGEVRTLSSPAALCAIDCSCPAAMPGGYVEGPLTGALWNGPYDIVYHKGSKTFYVSDGGNFVVRRIR